MSPAKFFPLILGLAVVPLPAQVDTTGIVPAQYRNSMSLRANSIPFSWTPTRFHSVYLGSELPAARVITCLAFRHGNRQDTGATIDMEITFGYTTFDHTTITSNYANNFNSGTPVVVYQRKNYRVPDMVTANTNPHFFLGQIQLDRPFVWQQQQGRNLLVEVRVFGNSNNNTAFGYFVEYASGSTTTRVFSSGNASATTGSVSRGLGPIYNFDVRCRVTAAFEAFGKGCPGTGGSGGNAIPVLGASGRPLINTTYKTLLSDARATVPAILMTGASDQKWGAISLPLDLGVLGAKGCSLLVSIDLTVGVVTDTSGAASLSIPLPSSSSLVGIRLFHQFLVLDKLANTGGLVTTNGARVTIGEQ